MYNYDKLVKTVVLGDSRVGKSCLILRIADDSYTESEITSIGIDFKIKDIEVENKKVRLQIWDTHRKINFRCPDDVPRQIRGAQAFLVLFDLTDWSSFENAKGIITQIDTSSKNVILVGTKSDLKHKRVVDTDDADNYAKEKHIDYMEVSAKNAYGVNPLSERLAQKALVPEIKESDRLSPEAVTALKESLRRYINRIEAHKITMNVGNASQPKIVTKNDYELNQA